MKGYMERQIIWNHEKTNFKPQFPLLSDIKHEYKEY